MFLIFAGLPGTGKSTLARALAERLGGVVLDKDLLRHEMFGPDRITFAAEQDDAVVEVMLAQAGEFLSTDSHRHVYFDGRVFSKNSQLKRVIDFADQIPARWIIIECVCSEETAKQRIEADQGKHIAANRTATLYDEVKARFQPIPEPKLVIDTDQPLAECLESLRAAIAKG